LGGLSGWVVGDCVVVVGGGSIGFGASRRGGSGLSVVGLTLGVVGAWWGGAGDVLEVVGVRRGSDGVDSEKRGGGVFIGSCGFCGEESWAKFCPLRRACRLCTTGLRRGAAVTVEGLVLGYVGREVGWYGGRESFDVGGSGSCRREQIPSSSFTVARSRASAGWGGLEEGG